MNVALWQHSGGECLLRGNQPPPPELPHCLAAEDHTLLPQADNRTLGPASAGPFLVSKHLGTISRVPGFALVRKRDDLPQHDETQASLRRGFFCTERSWACFQGWDPHCRCGNLGPYSRRHADQSITRRSASGFCGPAQRRHSAIRRSSPSKKWIALHIR